MKYEAERNSMIQAALTMLQVIAHAGKKLHENDNK